MHEEEARRAFHEAHKRGASAEVTRALFDAWKVALYGYAATNLDHVLFPLPADHPTLRGRIDPPAQKELF